MERLTPEQLEDIEKMEKTYAKSDEETLQTLRDFGESLTIVVDRIRQKRKQN